MMCKKSVLTVIGLGFFQIVSAEVMVQSLSEKVGAVDVYALKCSPLNNKPTAYATLSILDSTAGAFSQPQKLNVVLAKTGYAVVKKTVFEASSEELILKGGDGKYNLSVDTVFKGTTFSAQNYKIFYQCLNSDSKATQSSNSGLVAGAYADKTVSNNRVQVYTINCAANNGISPSSTSYLQLKIQNTTFVNNNKQSYLNAQLTKLDPLDTISTFDRFGDQSFGTEVKLQPISMQNKPDGDGIYYISVDATADKNTQVKKKDYALRYGCFTANDEKTVSKLTMIQNQ